MIMIKSEILSPLNVQNQNTNIELTEYIGTLHKKYKVNNSVLLIQAPQFLLNSFNLTVAKNRGYYAYPPTGLQCIAKALSGRNLEIDILDLNYLLLKRVNEDEAFDYHNWLVLIDEYLEKHSPSIVGVSSINIYSNVFEDGYPLTAILKHLRDKDEAIIIAGGPIATNEYDNYLIKDLSHFIIEGEGENKINFLFDCLFHYEPTQFPVKGIYFKSNDEIIQTAGKQDEVYLMGNLIDTYNLIPIEDYNKVGSLNPYSRMAGQQKHFSGIQLNRGCRANCRFCGVTEFMGKGVRHYPVKDVLDEIIYLIEKRNILHFDVLDDDFLVNKKEVVELLEALIKLRKKYAITWSANNGLIAVSITEEIMCLMRDSGCVGFRIGVESGNEDMLKRMRKPANLHLLRRSGVILNKFPELFTGGNYIIGTLGEETFAQMLDTFKFMCDLNLDWASIATFQFTSKAATINKNLKSDGRVAMDFVPSKGDSRREIHDTKDVVSGPEVFELPLEDVPSYEQIEQIWFSFNLVANYINNKNLKPGGIPEKFTSWVEAVRIAYPQNPYMSLFAGLGRVLLGDKEFASKHLEETKVILKESKYWSHCFSQFGLTHLVTDFPQNAQQVQETLGHLQKRYSKWIG